MTGKSICCGMVAVLSVAFAVVAAAQTYPAKPIRIVVPYAPGGATDLTARPIAQKLMETWGQRVLTDNRGGASGMIGADLVAKSPPDGHTMLLSASMEMTSNLAVYSKMPYDALKDFEPVTLASISPLVLMVHPSLPVKSVKELIALARAKPGALSYASIGTGTVHHFAGELMKARLKLDIVHVPYKGGAPALVALLSGEIPSGFVALLAAIPNVQVGKLRALAVTSERRASALPNVPTLAEAAALPGFDVVVWFAAWVPAKTPKDIIQKLNAELVRIIQSPEYKQRMIEAGAEAVGSTPEELRRLQLADIEKYRKIAITAGMEQQ